MTLRAYLGIFRQRWKLIALIVLLSTGIAVLITSMTAKVYTATAQIYVSANGPGSTSSSAYDKQAAILSQVTTFANLVDSPDILNAVKNDTHVPDTINALGGKISATAPPLQTIISLSATDGSPTTAALLANSAADEFVKYIEQVNTPSGTKTSSVQLSITNRAVAPTKATSPNPVLNTALGLVLGLLLGLALAVARDLLDNRIRDVEHLAKIAGRPAMGVVVEDPKADRHPIATRAGTRNIRAENFRQLRANLQFANVDAHPRVIAITSSVPSEGKTMVAVNLASALAEAGFTVCLVDADLRRPTVAKVTGLPSPVGLTSLLIHQLSLEDVMQNAGTNLHVVSSGPTPPNPSEVLASSYVRSVIHSLLDRVDYVVIDTAPLLPVADGLEVAALADGALLVGSYNMTTDVQVKRAVAGLDRVDAKLLGVVFNRVPAKRGEYGYTYYRRDQQSAAHQNRGLTEVEGTTKKRRQRRQRADVSE